MTDRRRTAMTVARGVAVGVAAALVLATAVMQAAHPYTTGLGTADHGGWLLPVAGAGLLVAAVLWPDPARGIVVATAACGVLLPEWSGWSAGPAALRALARGATGLTLLTAVGAVLILAPEREGSARARRWVLAAAALIGAIVLLHGFLLVDPFHDVGCWRDCRSNPFALGLDDGPTASLIGVGSVAVAAAAVVLGLRRSSREPSGRDRAAGWTIRVSTFALAAAAVLRVGWSGAAGPGSAVLWAMLSAGAAAGVLLGGVAVSARIQRVRTRRVLARLIEDLSATPIEGAVEVALAESLPDPTVRVVYWSPTRAAYVASDGTPAELTATATPIRRGGEPVAAVLHRPGIDSLELDHAFRPAVRLWLANAQLRAATLAELADLHASQERLAAASEAERRRIERDLHDGIQQRVVGISLLLRLARSRSATDATTPTELATLDHCRELLDDLLDTLRGLVRTLKPGEWDHQEPSPVVRPVTARPPATRSAPPPPDGSP